MWRGSGFVSFVTLILCVGCIIYDLQFYISVMWGKEDKLLHFISYVSFLICYSTYPVLNICSKFRSFLGSKENVSSMSWASSLNVKFITKRMQMMNIAEKGKKKGIIALLAVGLVRAAVTNVAQIYRKSMHKVVNRRLYRQRCVIKLYLHRQPFEVILKFYSKVLSFFIENLST